MNLLAKDWHFYLRSMLFSYLSDSEILFERYWCFFALEFAYVARQWSHILDRYKVKMRELLCLRLLRMQKLRVLLRQSRLMLLYLAVIFDDYFGRTLPSAYEESRRLH